MVLERRNTCWWITKLATNQHNGIKLLDFLKLGQQQKIGVRQSSLSLILKIFLIFVNLSLGDSYKKDTYKKSV